MITTTPPGADVLPWDGQTVERRVAFFWNGTQRERFTGLWQEVRNRVRPEGPFMLALVWEPQRRGVGHSHVVVPLKYHRVTVDALREFGPRWGFGFIDDGRSSKVRPGASASAVARYLAGYLAKGSKLAGVLEAIRVGVVPRQSFFVSRGLCGRTGITMRSLRLRRRAWAFLMVGARAPLWVELDEWAHMVESVRPTVSRGPPEGTA